MTLHERIAEKLGWTVEETRRFSLQQLREFVRGKSAKLDYLIDQEIRSGAHLVSGGRVKRTAKTRNGRTYTVWQHSTNRRWFVNDGTSRAATSAKGYTSPELGENAARALIFRRGEMGSVVHVERSSRSRNPDATIKPGHFVRYTVPAMRRMGLHVEKDGIVLARREGHPDDYVFVHWNDDTASRVPVTAVEHMPVHRIKGYPIGEDGQGYISEGLLKAYQKKFAKKLKEEHFETPKAGRGRKSSNPIPFAQSQTALGRGFKAGNPMQPTVRSFITILTGNLTQYDMAESAREAKHGGVVNTHRLSHLLGASQRLEEKFRGTLDSESPEHIKVLRDKILLEAFTPGFPPARKTAKTIDEYLTSGKLPKYPVSKTSRTSKARNPIAHLLK